MEIRRADLDDDKVRKLIEFHHADMLAKSPAGKAFVFDVDKLKAAGNHVLAVYDEEQLVGIGAVLLRGSKAELKSMRTLPARARSGIGMLLLAALEDTARDFGAKHLQLETGSGPAFESAGRFYAKHGFTPCKAFGDYRENDFNQFMSKAL